MNLNDDFGVGERKQLCAVTTGRLYWILIKVAHRLWTSLGGERMSACS